MREQTINAIKALKAIKAMQAVQGEPGSTDSPAANGYEDKGESRSETSAENASEVSATSGAGGALTAIEPDAVQNVAQKAVQATGVRQDNGTGVTHGDAKGTPYADTTGVPQAGMQKGMSQISMQKDEPHAGAQKSMPHGDKVQHGTGGASGPVAGGTRERRLDLAVDLAPYLRGWTLVSASLGHDGRAYVLLIDGEPVREAGFVPSGLQAAPRYKVLVVELRSPAGAAAQDVIEEIAVEGESFNYHYVQPLGADLLLVGARSRYYGRDQYDLNAAVFDRSGQPLRRFLVGDGIQSVQTTAGGLIWTSFFDEGVFGNYGWSRPVGESGLIAWDSWGIRVFTNSEADIADCYALNVVSDHEVWFYYYTDFKLCRLFGPAVQPSVSFLDPKLAGSSVVATDGARFLLDGGYNRLGTYTLLRRDGSGALTRSEEWTFADAAGRPLQAPIGYARGAALLLLDEAKLYVCRLDEWNERPGGRG